VKNRDLGDLGVPDGHCAVHIVDYPQPLAHAGGETLTSPNLPQTLSTDESSGGLGIKMVFERQIVFPDGRREIDGVTPKLPAPDDTKAIEP
jgi:hypothetical protein